MKTPQDIVRWLATRPKLMDLCNEFPEQWEIAQQQLNEVITTGSPEDLRRLTENPPEWPRHRKGFRQEVLTKAMWEATYRQVRYQMICLAVKDCSLSLASGNARGKVRFNFWNGGLAQWLLFSRGLERKMVSLRLFRLIWPLLGQRELLMPLVSSKGIYCFYSRDFVRTLAKLIGPRKTLEIGAGDGTLTRFLKGCGVKVTATDDYSWGHRIMYPSDVVKCDAVSALERYAPEVVVCSWPPAENPFEHHIFQTSSVQLYIMIGSQYQVASGSWGAYSEQENFEMVEAAELAKMLIPPELGSAVYLFTRIKSVKNESRK